MTASNLEPCPFTIFPLLRGTEHAIGSKKISLFDIPCGACSTISHFSFKYIIVCAINYDILVGQQAFTLLGLDWIIGLLRHDSTMMVFWRCKKGDDSSHLWCIGHVHGCQSCVWLCCNHNYQPYGAILLEDYFALIGKLEGK